jgi:hypothetical protein
MVEIQLIMFYHEATSVSLAGEARHPLGTRDRDVKGSVHAMTLPLREIMERHRITHLWHFTDRANLASIREHGGILSLKEIQQRGINIPKPGGSEISHCLDRKYELDGYVRLCFRNKHPMLYVARQEGRISDPIWLRVDGSIMLNPDVRFSIGVPYQNGVEIIDHEKAADRIDFEVLFTRTDWNDPEIQKRLQIGEKTEVLVPKIVPRDMILG